MTPSNVAVLAEDVAKVFRIPTERRDRLKEHVVHMFRRVDRREFEALKGVSLAVAPGEFFSIIGHNGSGKSTLLKILAGIYRPSRGRVLVDGRLSPFIELGVGFNPELSARDNVFLNGAILGMERRQVSEQFDEIIDFAELQPFVDLKLKNFSSGMMVRLAFSVAIRAHADILLIDEVLAVGDAGFQQKCFDVFRQLKAEGRTIIFVSHDLASVKEFSDRVMVLDHGEALGVFGAQRAITEYQRLNEQKANRDLTAKGEAAGTAPTSERRPSIRSVRMRGPDGETSHVFHRGDDVTVLLTIDNPDGLPLDAGVAIYRSDGLYCFGTNTVASEVPSVCSRRAEIEVTFHDLPLQRGSYYLMIALAGKHGVVYEFREHEHDFQVAQWDQYEGVMFVRHDWRAR